MTYTNPYDIKTELVYSLRNNDVLSTTIRGVTTTSKTGTYSGATTDLISVPNIKNIRSIVVDGTTLTYGTDYTYSIDYNDSGTIKTKVTFTSGQTGAYTINYDYGPDKIYPDFPKQELTISAFPRIALDIISGTSKEISLGAGTIQNEYLLTIVAYDSTQSSIETMINNIREWLMNNKKNFYYSKFVTLTNLGPILKTPYGRNKILQRNQDAIVKFVFDS